MNCFSKNIFRRQQFVLMFCLSLFLVVNVSAKNNAFEINYLNVTQLDDELRIDAEINYELNDDVKDALVNGITLLFQVEVQIKSLRKWVWDKKISEITQTYMLKYHALSKQYIWENLDTGSNKSFPDLDSALVHQGRISAMYVAEMNNLSAQDQHIVQIRSRLLTSKLPLPLRMRSYVSAKWRLTSGWHIWPL